MRLVRRAAQAAMAVNGVNMIGEKIGETNGKITSMRVLACEGRGPKVECSVTETGTLLGIGITEIATYWSVARPDGTHYGEGHGIVMTKDGDQASWTGTGLGRPTGRGSGMAWRASVYYQTSSPKLARLNDVVGLIEFETDENGDTTAQTREWKGSGK